MRFFSFVFGEGSFSTIWSNKSSTPSPVFAETRRASEVSIPIVCSMSSFTLSGSDAGKSALLRTGSISWFTSIAW